MKFFKPHHSKRGGAVVTPLSRRRRVRTRKNPDLTGSVSTCPESPTLERQSIKGLRTREAFPPFGPETEVPVKHRVIPPTRHLVGLSEVPPAG